MIQVHVKYTMVINSRLINNYHVVVPGTVVNLLL